MPGGLPGVCVCVLGGGGVVGMLNLWIDWYITGEYPATIFEAMIRVDTWICS